ncbi:MAG: peroxide stress protein YaaA [Lachnospiraceae bacterium]|nr:peroxide stress protein YaaA [Lachnospiraceae bacterium]
MRVIIAPAKRMREEGEWLEVQDLPVFLERSEELKQWICGLSYEEAKKLWKCNEKIAWEAYARFQRMDLDHAFTPAVLSYDGIQYQYLAPAVMEERELSYLQEHLRILSGFYGILRPMDAVVPYRLEMQAKTEKFGHPSLYEYWGDTLYRQIAGETDFILNLASKEYARCVEPYLEKHMRFLTCIFGDLEGNRVVQKGTKAKMARGEMVRFLAQNRIEHPDQLKDFEGLGYHYDQERSDETMYVFVNY